MSEVVTAISIFDQLIKIFGLVKSGKIERDEKVDLALSQTHKALVETQAYIRIMKAQSRYPEKEKDLAIAWYDASVPMRHVDKKLATICSSKGGYWSDPDSWTSIKSGSADISLANVEKLVFELLTSK